MGYITTAFSLDTVLWNEMENLRKKHGIPRSYFVQSSLRMKISQMKKQTISEFLNNIDEKEMDILKKEIKKRGN